MTRSSCRLAAFGIAVFGLSSLSLALASRIKSDETVWFFPTAAVQQADGTWLLPIHGWVFEIEGGFLAETSPRRWSSATVGGSVDRLLGLADTTRGNGIFRDRVRFFTPLLDNERRKEIEIHIGDAVVELSPTASNGHVYDDVRYSGDVEAGAWLTFGSPHPTGVTVEGSVQLVPPTGRSVISDIDDTIKVSEVLDKQALLANTFARPYRGVDGMAEFYAGRLRGRYFHYVSASPWRLYPALEPFLSGFPRGAVYLRHFRLQDGSFVDFLRGSASYKAETIGRIIEAYPGHTFTLIGDAGENDPGAYADMHSRYAGRVEAILIRNIPGAEWTEESFRQRYPDIPDAVWTFFDDPRDLVK